jgi:type VI secretion system secreted protein Hcp
MALTAFLTLQVGGEKVTGSSRFKNHEGKILLIGLSHEIGSERDATGLPTGKRKHRQMILTKDIDRSSTLLQQAFADNVEFSQGLIQFTRFSPKGGGQEIHAEIVLTKVQITSLRSVMPNAMLPANSAIPEYEELGIAYRSIEWRWLGLDVDDTDTQYKDEDCDFSQDEPTWLEALAKRVESAMALSGQWAGKAAAKALQDAVKPPPDPDAPK